MGGGLLSSVTVHANICWIWLEIFSAGFLDSNDNVSSSASVVVWLEGCMTLGKNKSNQYMYLHILYIGLKNRVSDTCVMQQSSALPCESLFIQSFPPRVIDQTALWLLGS